MIISDFAIKRPLITVVAMVAMVIFGFFAWFNLKTDDIDVNPQFEVGIVYPGASPEVIEAGAQAGRGGRLDCGREASWARRTTATHGDDRVPV
jgi:hypothetical protein